MRLCLLLLLLFLSPAQSWSVKNDASKTDIVNIAERYLNVREVGKNRGKMVEKFQRSVHLPAGSPWCAAFIKYILDEAKNIFIKIRSGLAQAYVTKYSVKAKDVAKGYVRIGRNWLAIWRHGDTRRGHIGIVKNWLRNKGIVIEGNTKVGNAEGVFEKARKIISWREFRIVWFTPTVEIQVNNLRN